MVLFGLQDLCRAIQPVGTVGQRRAAVILEGVGGALKLAIYLPVRMRLKLPQQLTIGRIDAGDTSWAAGLIGHWCAHGPCNGLFCFRANVPRKSAYSVMGCCPYSGG